MSNPYDDLAAHLQASTSSQPAKEWLRDLKTYIEHWPSTSSHQNIVRLPETKPHPPAGDIVGYIPESSVPAPGPISLPTSQSLAMQSLLGAAAKDLRAARAETRERADRAFNVALALGIGGGLAVFTGIGLALGGTIAIGATTSVAGAVSSIFSNIFAKLYRTENTDLRQMVRDLRRIEEARLGLWLADQITDPKARNEAIRALIDRSAPSAKP